MLARSLTGVTSYDVQCTLVVLGCDIRHTHPRSATTMIFANLTSRRRSGLITRRQLARAAGEYERTKIQEAKGILSVTVIDDAKSSERRTGPPRLLITLSGALLSFCFAVVWLCGREFRINAHPEDSVAMVFPAGE